VLLVLALGALWALLPGWIDSPDTRERIAEAARAATGRELRYESLHVGILPPRLQMNAAVLAGETPEAPPFAEAGEVSLRVALAPLFGGAVVLETVVVEDATVRVVRDRDGLRLPEPPEAEAPEGPAEPAPPADGGATDAPAEAGPALAVQHLRLRRVNLELEDRTVDPPVRWELRDVDATASVDLAAPIEIEADAKLGGGTVAVNGTVDLAAETLDLAVRLDGVALAPLAPYLPGGRELAGTLSGNVVADGAFAAPGLEADLRLAEGRVRVSGVGLEGPLAVRADLAGGDAPAGSFDVDATAAALDAYDGAFRKPAGKPGSVKGRFVPKDGGGITVDDLEVKIHNLDARGRVDVNEAGDRVTAEITAEPVDLAGWEEILPALAEYRPAGTLRPGTLRFASEPLSIEGRIGLSAVKLVVPDGPEIGLEGAVEATGDTVKLVDVALATGGETVRLAGEVAGLAQERPRYRLAVDSDGAETNTLLSAFSDVDDQVFGPLFVDLDLAGRTADPTFEALSGRVVFAIRPGKIEGVSPLQLTVAKLGTFGEAALLAAALDKPARAQSIERYYGDEFEELAGTFDVAGGWARTRDLRLVYDGYRMDLAGGLRLADQRLDFSGTLTLEPRVDEALAGAATEGTGEPAAPPEPRVIRLAEVKGTLADPKIDLSSSVVRSWVGGYTGKKLRDEYQEKIDEKLGEQLGGEVGDLVEGLLGGKKKR